MINHSLLTYHPLYYITLGLIAGIIAASLGNLLALSCIFMLCIAGICIAKTKGHNSLSFALMLACLGVGIATVRCFILDRSYQAHKQTISSLHGDLLVTITNIYHTPDKQWPVSIRASLQQGFDERKQQIPLKGDLTIYCLQESHLLPGDTVLLKRPAIIPCSEKKTLFFKKEGIVGSIFSKRPRAILIHRPSISLSRWSYQLLKKIRVTMSSRCNQRTLELFNTFFLGAPSSASSIKTTKKQYQLWGIAHYMARSGLHLMIIIWLLMQLCTMIPIHQRYKNGLFLIVIIFYSITSWASTSFLRAFWTFIVAQVSQLLMIDIHSVEIITLVTAVFLLYNPLMIFFADFQLSFLLTYGLIVHQKQTA